MVKIDFIDEGASEKLKLEGSTDQKTSIVDLTLFRKRVISTFFLAQAYT